MRCERRLQAVSRQQTACSSSGGEGWTGRSVNSIGGSTVLRWSKVCSRVTQEVHARVSHDRDVSNYVQTRPFRTGHWSRKKHPAYDTRAKGPDIMGGPGPQALQAPALWTVARAGRCPCDSQETVLFRQQPTRHARRICASSPPGL